MYEFYLDGKNLYYPGDKVNALSSAILDRKLSESGRLDIKVPPTNPLFASFKERVSEVAVYENGVEIWNGEVRSVNGNMRNERTVYILGELSYLNASSQPQKKYDDIELMQFFKALLDEHNSRVETRKQFHIGIVTVENVNNITSWVTNYEKTLDYIRTEMCEKLNGYLRIRKVNGIRYLDLIRLEDYGKSTEQPIKFGKNLLDYTSDITSDSIVTAIRPLGVKLEESNVEDLDAYTTISSVNNGSDSLVNQDAIDSGIGYVWETVHFKGITDPAELMMAGKNWIQSKQFADMTITVTAVDLSKLNSKIESFELGDSVRTVAEPFGMDKWSYIMQKKVDLLNPTTKHNITIGEKLKKTYTQQVSMMQSFMEKQLPQQTILLELAKKNASEIIKTATEGNIYLNNDENGVPRELLIMDTPDINTAMKVWRWNINGLGYSSTGYNGTFKLAMTMDGAIVADMIKTGILNANLIRAGVIQSLDKSSYWDLENNEIHINGTLCQSSEDGSPAVVIADNQIDMYDWRDDHSLVGGLATSVDSSTRRKGLTLWCDSDDEIIIGYLSDYNTATPVFTMDAQTAPTQPPWIRNTATGTLFPNHGGVKVQNGLITDWNITGATGTIQATYGQSTVNISVKDGLITGWSYT